MTVAGLARSVLESLGLDARAIYQSLSSRSLEAALREQQLDELCERLGEIRPDLSDQYTRSFDSQEFGRYWERKMRGLHAFQVRAALDALEVIEDDGLTIVDIGDSSGNHLAYLDRLAPPGKIARMVSVNLDPVAIDKIRAKGGEAVMCRAEDIGESGLAPDLVLVLETLEHLTDPVRFLHGLAVQCDVEHVLVTVPFRRRSRFGGALMRQANDSLPDIMTPEQVHIFELSPEDWCLLCRFGGYRTTFQRIYRQYPSRSPFRLTAPLWRSLDFEGFVALLLTKDLSLAERYVGW